MDDLYRSRQELLGRRAAQAAYARKVEARWEEAGGRPKPKLGPVARVMARKTKQRAAR